VSLPLQRGRRRRLVIARGSLADGEAPFAALEHLDPGWHGLRHLTTVLLALALHASLGAAAALQHGTGAHRAPPAFRPPIEASLQRPALALPPPPPPEPAPPKPLRAARAPRPSRTPPAPAQAGRVIAQAPAPAGPTDLTGFDLVVGQGESYAGGYSSAKGTSRNAVADPNARIGGVPDAPPSDLSRPASPLRREWACPWPEQMQDSEVRYARVTIRVSVTRDGNPSRVEILAAPPGGFAEAARRCAEGDTHLINVNFQRG
jgi:periplasmic protein TonB